MKYVTQKPKPSQILMCLKKRSFAEQSQYVSITEELQTISVSVTHLANNPTSINYQLLFVLQLANIPAKVGEAST
jgi:hypothetical protein